MKKGIKMTHLMAAAMAIFLSVIAFARVFGISHYVSDQELADVRTVVTYEDVFASYYEEAMVQAERSGRDLACSFDEFCEGYYESDMTIQSYADSVVAEGNGCEAVAVTDEASPATASSDAYYILNGISDPDSDSFDPDVTPASAFGKKHLLLYKTFDYSVIEEGDIVIETATIFSNMGHAALVYDTEKPAEAASFDDASLDTSAYLQTVEAVNSGVNFGYLDDNRMVEYGVVILRTTSCSSSKIQKALSFAYDQLGDDYYLPLTAGSVSTEDADSWYCSELVYTSYYVAGYNLYAVNSDGWCFPTDLINSSRTAYVCVSDCVDVRLLGKEDGDWKIRVYNTTDSAVTVEYNSKLCLKSDAKNWENLDDVETVTVKANGYATVYVSTNWFAKTAAFSRTVGTQRSVTYCNDLNSSTLRMSIYKNIV